MSKIYFLMILYILVTLIRMPVASTVSKSLAMPHTTEMIVDFLDLSSCLNYLLLNKYFNHNFRSVLTLTIYQRYAKILNTFSLHISWDLLRRYDIFLRKPLDRNVPFPEPSHRVFWPESLHHIIKTSQLPQNPTFFIPDTTIIEIFQKYSCQYDREQNAKGTVTASINWTSLSVLPINYDISSRLFYLYPRSEYESTLSVLVRLPMVLVFERLNLDRKILSIIEWTPIKYQYDDDGSTKVSWYLQQGTTSEADTSKNWQMKMLISKNQIVKEIHITFVDNDGYQDVCYFSTSDQGHSYQAYDPPLKDSFYKRIIPIYYPDPNTSDTEETNFLSDLKDQHNNKYKCAIL